MTLSNFEFHSFMDFVDRVPENKVFEPNLYYDKEAYEGCKAIDEAIWDPQRYPGIFDRLRRTRDAHKKQPRGNLFSFSLNDEPETKIGFYESGVRIAGEIKNFSTASFAAILDGFLALDMVLIAIDREKQEFIVISPQPKVWAANDVFVDLYADFGVSGTSGDYVFLLDAAWDPRDGSAPRRVQSKLTSGVGFQVSDDPVLSAPVRTSDRPLDPSAITIGLGRPYTDWGPGSAMDYSWNQPGQYNPRGMIPFVGSSRFDEPIKPLQPKQNFIVTMSVVNTFGGGGYIPIQPQDMQQIYNGFSIDGADPNKLTWSFPAGQAGNPVVFDRINWPSDMHAIFFFRALVFLESGLPAQVTIRSNTGTPANPPDGHLPILPINFIWHCVAEDTMVLMGDKSRKPIQDVVAGDIVLADVDVGGTEVLWTTKGVHHGSVIEVVTDNGAKIVSTANHVFVSENGLIHAGELKRGMKLFVFDEKNPHDLLDVTITRIAKIDGSSAQMFNIGVKNLAIHDKVAGLFFGNEFLMGDASADQVVRAQQKTDLCYLKSILPVIHHTDLESHFHDSSIQIDKRK